MADHKPDIWQDLDRVMRDMDAYSRSKHLSDDWRAATDKWKGDLRDVVDRHTLDEEKGDG